MVKIIEKETNKVMKSTFSLREDDFLSQNKQLSKLEQLFSTRKYWKNEHQNYQKEEVNFKSLSWTIVDNTATTLLSCSQNFDINFYINNFNTANKTFKLTFNNETKALQVNLLNNSQRPSEKASLELFKAINTLELIPYISELLPNKKELANYNPTIKLDNKGHFIVSLDNPNHLDKSIVFTYTLIPVSFQHDGMVFNPFLPHKELNSFRPEQRKALKRKIQEIINKN